MGFENQSKLENIEKKLQNKHEELTQLRDTMEKKDEKLFKLEKENNNILSQFVTLLQTCETFQQDLETLKKSNTELKTELERMKYLSKVPTTQGPTKTASTAGNSLLGVS